MILRIIQRLSESGYNMHVCLLCIFISVDYLPRIVDKKNMKTGRQAAKLSENFLLVRLNYFKIGFVWTH